MKEYATPVVQENPAFNPKASTTRFAGKVATYTGLATIGFGFLTQCAPSLQQHEQISDARNIAICGHALDSLSKFYGEGVGPRTRAFGNYSADQVLFGRLPCAEEGLEKRDSLLYAFNSQPTTKIMKANEDSLTTKGLVSLVIGAAVIGVGAVAKREAKTDAE